MIYQVVLLNANGISGNVANILHIYLFCNETSEFFYFNSVSMFRIKFASEIRKEFFKFKSIRSRFAFKQIHARKYWFACVRRSKMTCNSEGIFLVVGNFYRVRIARNRNFTNTRDWRKLIKFHQSCQIEMKICRQTHFKKLPNSATIRQTSGNGCIFTKTLMFSLEISHLELFYLTPCILPESV